MSDIATASLVLSSFVLAVAGLLGWREWRDRRDRAPGLSEADARHFGHQDRRRLIGIVVLVLLAIALVVGSRISPRLANRANPQFLGLWLGVFLLILFLLSLAMFDWVALRIFARRHRNEILRERLELLQEENRRKKALIEERDNGRGEGPLHDLFH